MQTKFEYWQRLILDYPKLHKTSFGLESMKADEDPRALYVTSLHSFVFYTHKHVSNLGPLSDKEL